MQTHFTHCSFVVSTLVMVLLSFALISCNAANNNNDVAESLYSKLYLVHNSPDFPADADVFSVCEKKVEEPCHKVISMIKKSIASLRAVDHQRALNITIKNIDKYCNESDGVDDANIALCEGALTSIYLFNKKTDDVKFIQAFKAFSKTRNTLIFNRNRAWYYNRENTNIWLNHVKSVLIDQSLDLQVWRFEQVNVKPFGLMYFESPISQGNNLTY